MLMVALFYDADPRGDQSLAPHVPAIADPASQQKICRTVLSKASAAARGGPGSPCRSRPPLLLKGDGAEAVTQ